MNANETIADIAVEKRHRADEIERIAGQDVNQFQRELIADLRNEANRIEAAWKRECEALMPKPDPEWEFICERCRDGDLFPDCEYFGEPNGCNSPIYGEHPKTKPTGNAAAMREALLKAKKAICHHAKHVCDSLSWENSNIQSNCADVLCAHRDLCEAKTAINNALSAPPRNCDVGTAEEQKKRFEDYCVTNRSDDLACLDCPAYGKGDCEFRWGQMPYTDTAAEKGESDA